LHIFVSKFLRLSSNNTFSSILKKDEVIQKIGVVFHCPNIE
jgi:hypothetical protein